jgi:thiamine monophosphate synthase
MDKKKVNYGVYLVTDSTPAILGNKDLASVVEAAVRGGATIVQYRDKLSDRATAVRTAKRLLEVTRRHGVPLLVNDRVDVAVEVGCEGVHIGQDDMGEFDYALNLINSKRDDVLSFIIVIELLLLRFKSVLFCCVLLVDINVEWSYKRRQRLTRDTAYEEARKLLGPDKIIGVTASSIQEALKACEAGADYLGLGTVYATQT